MSHKKFLEFNERSIYFLAVDGTYWVALKPICDALGVNWNRQFQNLKEDEIFSQLFAEQQMVGADGKLRKMISLPEKWVYGWLLSIRSESAELKEYKLTCYNLLYDHFHGTLTQSQKRRADVDTKLTRLKVSLYENNREMMDEIAKLEVESRSWARETSKAVREQYQLFKADSINEEFGDAETQHLEE